MRTTSSEIWASAAPAASQAAQARAPIYANVRVTRSSRLSLSGRFVSRPPEGTKRRAGCRTGSRPLAGSREGDNALVGSETERFAHRLAGAVEMGREQHGSGRHARQLARPAAQIERDQETVLVPPLVSEHVLGGPDGRISTDGTRRMRAAERNQGLVQRQHRAR